MSSDCPSWPWFHGDLGIHDTPSLLRWAQKFRIASRDLRAFRRQLYREEFAEIDATARLMALAGQTLEPAQSDRIAPLTVLERRDSREDGSTKLVFSTLAGLRFETMILRVASGRTTLCVSSQVGCAAACRFCATGSMKLARSLSTVEILAQVLQAHRVLRPEGRRVRNLVFMGMGEPLHNARAVYSALDVLTCPQRFASSPRRVTVSTVGIVPEMLELARTRPKIRQALSLHAADPEVRQFLVPMTARYSVAALRSAVYEINATTGETVMIESALFAGVNDRASDVAAMLEFCAGLDVHVNLIPYNDVGVPGLRASSRERIAAIADCLRSAGLVVTVRHSLGQDIAGACGQLVRGENRQLLGLRSARTTNPGMTELE